MVWRFSASEPSHRVLSARFGLVVCLGLAAFVFPPVLAAHVELMSVTEITAAAPSIVVATVEGRRSRWNDLHTLILTDYTLHVEERLRGTLPDRITVTLPGGTLDTVSDDTCISVRLEPKARYLLFLGELHHSTLGPVIGAEQGVFREVVGAARGARASVSATLAAPGSSSVPLLFHGTPVSFKDFVVAVRSLAARIPLAPRPVSPAALALPAKAWSPGAPSPAGGRPLPPLAAPAASLPGFPALPAGLEAGAPGRVEVAEIAEAESTAPRPASGLPPGKFLYHELAPRPVVINPLVDSPFSPWDQYQMAHWNRYGGDLFRVSASPTATWAYQNGVSDIVGFPDDATMKRQFDYDWADLGQGVLAVAFVRREEGVVVEADLAFNPHKRWTLDDLAATSRPDSDFAFKEVVLHELGHAWGLWHPWDDEEWVTWDSVMNYKPRQYYVAALFADDTAAVRRAFPPGVPIRDGLISSYVTVRDPILVIPDYATPRPTPATVRAGGPFDLAGPIKIENVGTVALLNPAVEVYLTPARLSFDGALLVQRAKVSKKVPPGGTLQVKLKGLKVPRGAAAGTYYLAYLLRDPKDAYQGNNAAWSLDGFTLTVTR
jgi:hypothetical protein